MKKSYFMDRLSGTPELSGCVDSIVEAFKVVAACYEAGGKLLIAGNGGSFADALHIAGELMKRFECKRCISADLAEEFLNLPHGDVLAQEIEPGLPAIVLGSNGALLTAIINDKNDQRVIMAQECMALGCEGDVLLGISTSGNAEDIIMAMSVAKVKGMKTIALTGMPGGNMASGANVAICAPGKTTGEIQEYHVKIYHALCAGVEAHFFLKE